MERRTFMALVSGGLLVAPLTADAQQAAKIARIGYLVPNLAASPPTHEAFRQGLRDLGYVEGRNVVIETRDAEGKLERLPALADGLPILHIVPKTIPIVDDLNALLCGGAGATDLYCLSVKSYADKVGIREGYVVLCRG